MAEVTSERGAQDEMTSLLTAERDVTMRLLTEARAHEMAGSTERALAAISEAHTMLDLWRSRLLGQTPSATVCDGCSRRGWRACQAGQLWCSQTARP